MDLINFYGPPGTFNRITVEELKDDPTNEKYADLLNGKVLVFGMQKSREAALKMRDEEQIRVSYSNELMYGAEIHATIAANLLHKNWIRTVDTHLQGFIIAFSVFLISVIEFFVAVPIACISIAILLILGTVGTYLAFSHWLIWIPAVPAILCFSFFSIAIVTPFRLYLSERLETIIKKRMKKGLDI